MDDIRITWEKDWDKLVAMDRQGNHLENWMLFGDTIEEDGVAKEGFICRHDDNYLCEHRADFLKKYIADLLEKAVTQAYNAGIKQGKEETKAGL